MSEFEILRKVEVPIAVTSILTVGSSSTTSTVSPSLARAASERSGTGSAPSASPRWRGR